MRRLVIPVLGVLTVVGTACSRGPEGVPAVEAVESPAAPGSGQPNLAVGADGKLYLSWIEPGRTEGHALRFSIWEEDSWSRPRTVATGDNWFVNWADFPSMAALKDGTLAAHWLAKSGPRTYAYDLLLSVSRDGGETWSDPVIPHRDGTKTEHGFVSLVPTSEGTFAVVWLDGREMEAAVRGHVGGAMTLRYATLDGEGQVSLERLIDNRVCDCCPTDAIPTEDGSLLVAYRDRSASEIRDIYVSRLQEDAWTTPRAVHRDDWLMPACPVNGPAVATADAWVACAWFTVAEQRGLVRVAFSRNGGRSFGEPVRVDGGNPVGRVDLVLLEDGTALVSWLEESEIRLRWVTSSGKVKPPLVAATTSNSRASGFPRMVRFGSDIFLAWTEPGEPSHVRTAVLR